MKRPCLCIGLISDTHGLLRPQALDALRGSDFIVHAGDIGDPAILDALGAIAPVTAVRGNNDRDARFDAVPISAVLVAGTVRVLVIHQIDAVTPEAAAGCQAVVTGHSHRPQLQRRQGVLYLNPGSAGPRRFKLPVSVGRLTVRGTALEGELLTLAV